MTSIGNLRILTDPAGSMANPHSPFSPQYVELAPHHPEFKVLKSVIHLGLSMLESSRGRQILNDIGVNTVNYYRQRGQAIHYTAGLNNMSSYISYFLRTVRNDFFNTYLTNNIRTQGGAAQTQLGFPSADLRNYQPKLDGRIKMSKMVRTMLILLHIETTY